MSEKYRKDISFSLATFFLKFVGIWLAANRFEEWFRNTMVVYTIATLIFSIWIHIRNVYFFGADFSISGYILCSCFGLIMDLYKIILIFIHKTKFLSLIVYMRKNFWHFNYNKYENLIIADAKQVCFYFVFVFSFFSQSTVCCYVLRPLISNIGKNESERALIFNMWLDLPLSKTPYFEIMYLLQALSLCQAGACYLCFDNMFCIMCLHVASQFRVLQYRVANIQNVKSKGKHACFSEQCYVTLKRCIQQHQSLIKFCATLEEVCSMIILGQVILFSVLISFIGYQVILVELTPAWRLSFMSYLMSTMCQLWMFAYSCDCVTRESANVSLAVYTGPWVNSPMDEFGKMIRKNLQLVVIKSRRACNLTACGFFPVSLETYTKIISTAMSYFTLLKQSAADACRCLYNTLWKNDDNQLIHNISKQNVTLSQFKCNYTSVSTGITIFHAVPETCSFSQKHSSTISLLRNTQQQLHSLLIRSRSYKFRIDRNDGSKSNMRYKGSKDVSFSLTAYFLRVVGFWSAANREEEWIRSATIIYTIVTLVVAIWNQMSNLYLSWGNFGTIHIFINKLSNLFKVLTLLVHKKKFLNLIAYMQKNFWRLNFDEYENLFIADAKQMCIYFVCVFSFFSLSSTFTYMIRPLISNIGKNESERILIYNMQLDLPLTKSPYFEITYVLQALVLYQVGICYLCFDNIFCIICLHVAGQFRILQYKMANVQSVKGKHDGDPIIDSTECYEALRNYIQQHQSLTEFCATFEMTFTSFILGQAVTFSTLICFLGYLVLLVDVDPELRITFGCFLITAICQLWIFTYSCDCVTQESMNVSLAAYAGPWTHSSMDAFGKMVRKDLQFVIVRSRRACSLTACGFFPVSLETYTKVMSTAMSYFTLLKQHTIDATDT
ncbi:uncharacterized protein LOC143428182 [Xylocopa sonorina]|uniref:uncharacterized protein LOC143428182 n=1 Tax=Xylocopa sonorina TaxID=1818115 RepID=UPI00403AA615